MQKAKEAISGMLHKDGTHDANISQTVNNPVTHEQVHEHKTHHNTTATDREIHETHHQTTVQPVKDREVREEQHHTNILPTETKHIGHGKDRDVERTLQEQRSGFTDSTEVLPEQHHRGETKAHVGEHHHHHIQEHIQPVIEKQTVQSHVVHNVAPVHEIIEKEPVIHNQSVNPAMSMEEFKRSGVGKGGTHHEHHDYQGDPMHVSKSGDVTRDHHDHHHHHGSATSGTGLGSSHTGTHTGTGNDTTGNYSHGSSTTGGMRGDGHRDSDHSSNPRSTGGLGENIIGSENRGADGRDHKMRETMRDDDHEKDTGKRSLLDKLTGK